MAESFDGSQSRVPRTSVGGEFALRGLARAGGRSAVSLSHLDDSPVKFLSFLYLSLLRRVPPADLLELSSLRS